MRYGLWSFDVHWQLIDAILVLFCNSYQVCLVKLLENHLRRLEYPQKLLAGWWLYTHPSEKWWSSSIGMISYSQYFWENIKWQPNHQPARTKKVPSNAQNTWSYDISSVCSLCLCPKLGNKSRSSNRLPSCEDATASLSSEPLPPDHSTSFADDGAMEVQGHWKKRESFTLYHLL